MCLKKCIIGLCPKKCIIACVRKMHHCMCPKKCIIALRPKKCIIALCLKKFIIACARYCMCRKKYIIACARRNASLDGLDIACARRNASSHCARDCIVLEVCISPRLHRARSLHAPESNQVTRVSTEVKKQIRSLYSLVIFQRRHPPKASSFMACGLHVMA